MLDTAFSGSSHGKIRVFHQKGATIPSNWAFDADGKPTTDPAKAIEGLLQPIGEYKGVGLAIAMGVLSAMISGASYGTELGNMVDGAKPGRDGHFFLALKLAAFEEPARFKRRVDGLIQEVQTSRRGEGMDRLYAPGQLEATTAESYQRDGVPLNESTRAGLADVARELGVDSSPLGE